MNSIKKVIVVHKTHLDIGFTNSAESVLERYVNEFIPKAIETARVCNQNGERNFVWSVGSFMIKYCLEYLPDREPLIQAIRDGYIAWHGLAVTSHTELMNRELFLYDIGIAKQLDQQFSKHTIAAKMTDVPGHTLAIVPYLEENGIKYLHLGCNHACTPPDVPPLCLLKYGDSKVILNYAGDYGEAQIFGEYALEFSHTYDNAGPPTAEQVFAEMDRLHKKYPNAQIVSGRMDDFAQLLLEDIDKLPVVSAELGDTWIHGAASDPFKMGAFYELLRIRDFWLSEDPEATSSWEYDQFMLNLLLICEHTWGMDCKTWLKDFDNWDKQEFKRVCKDANYVCIENSWAEQREYLRYAMEELPEKYRTMAKERVGALRPEKAPVRVEQEVSRHLTVNGYEIEILEDGRVKLLSSPGKAFAQDMILGDLIYCVYSADTAKKSYLEYCRNIEETESWAYPDIGKPGLEKVKNLTDRNYRYQLQWTAREENRLILCLTSPEEASVTYGAPKTAVITYKFDDKIRVTLQWFEKECSRIPEAVFFGFQLGFNDPEKLTVTKLGLPIKPYHVCRNGNRKLHAVSGLQYDSVHIQNLHSPLLSVGGTHLFDVDESYGPIEDGMYYVLFNNRWNTNFPMWYGENAAFEYVITL